VVYLHNYIYAISGHNGSIGVNTVERIRVAEETNWELVQIANIPIAFDLYGVMVNDYEVLIFGGMGKGNLCNESYRVNLIKNECYKDSILK